MDKLTELFKENPKISILSILGVFLILGLFLIFLIFTTDTGKEALSKTIGKLPEKKNTLSISFDENGKPQITTDQAIENLTIRSKQTLNDSLYLVKMNLLRLSRGSSIYELDINYTNVDNLLMDKNQNNKYVKTELQESVDKLSKMVTMSKNSDKVIRISVKNVNRYKLFYNNVYFKKEFFLAKLNELKISLSTSFLQKITIEEGKKIYAQLAMIKSISHYLDYQPDEAYRNYILAQKAFTSLRVISELKKEYKDIAPRNAEEMKFAYVLVASVQKSETNMKKTADRLLARSKASAFREKNHDLYLSINSTKIRVYTILEYHSKAELKNKINEIESIEKTALIYSTSKSIPKEYILRETRKKIFVYRTSKRANDKYLVNILKSKDYKQIEDKGYWGKEFDVYAVYYDGNSCDDSDLEKLLDDTRDAINSHAVSAFAYQQSHSKKIERLFKDKNLKYIIILEKNAYVKKN